MKFDLDHAEKILGRTPGALRALLAGLPDEWTNANEGPDTWSPFDVVGHLVHGDEVDWIPRARLILEHGAERPFTPFDRYGQFEKSKGKSLEDLLGELAEVRRRSLKELRALNLSAGDLDRTGGHPELGPVTLGELLAAWVVHDLGHLRQVARVLAKQYAGEVGAWREYLPVVRE